MKVYHDIEALPELNQTVFTQGTFDGVHLGHVSLLNEVVTQAKRIGGESVLLTFWPHPKFMLFPEDNELKLLQSLEEKLEAFEAIGIDHVLVLPFTQAFSAQLPLDYISGFLVNALNMHTIIVGYDHRFGKNREGDIHLLKQYASTYNYKVIEVSAKDVDQIAVSSTKIRHALNAGQIELANDYLGRPYQLSGTVVSGKQLGRTLGFPTANIELPFKHKLIPAKGVYVVKVWVQGQAHYGMMNIGDNPTIADKSFSIEVNILDFNADIYGQTLRVDMLSWLRSEKKFKDINELAQNLKLDETHAREKINSL